MPSRARDGAAIAAVLAGLGFAPALGQTQEPAGVEGEGVPPAAEAPPAPEETAPPLDEAPADDPPEDGADPSAEAAPETVAPPEGTEADPAGPDGVVVPGSPEAAAPPAPEAAPAPGSGPEILRDPGLLPAPARATFEAIRAAARSGDIARLAPLLSGPAAPRVAKGELGDPLAYLRSLSADAEGREILAILSELLDTGFVRVNAGTPEEAYVWPYLAALPTRSLTPEQVVELFRLVSVGDYQDMLAYGAYIFFRVEIGADGRWRAFAAGD